MSETEEIENAKQVAAGVLGEKMAKFPLLFAKAAFFGQRPSKKQPRSDISNGTVSLVDLGDGPLAITCEHVIAGYIDMAKVHDNLVFQIGSVEINPLEQLIDKNAQLDLATIRLTEEQIKSITSEGEIGSCVFRPKAWPPEALKKGQFVAFGGFPGCLRTVASFDEHIFESWSSGASQISSVSEGKFLSAFEREFWVKSFGTESHMNIDTLGGLSGGPVFIHRGLYWDFVGIVSQYHENFDAMFFASTSGLRANGTITPPPV